MPPQNYDNSKNRGQSPDPYLRSFLRQAVAIIAAERGFNDSCSAKLRVIAEQLGLAEETIQEAIEKLKAPQSNLGLNRYESEFFKFLKKEFERISGNVINIGAERKLVDLAESRYQIEAVRAHQIIQKVADQCNVGTISHSDAKQFAEQLIEDTVANQTGLPNSEKQRLIRTCRKWGLEADHVEHGLRAIFSRNRRKLRRRTAIFCVSVVSLALIGLGCVYAIANTDWKLLLSNGNETKLKNSEIDLQQRDYPNWWTKDIIAAADQLNGDMTNRINALIELDKSNSRGREKLYAAMINQYLRQIPRDENLEKWFSLVYCFEPDSESATAMLNEIRNNIAPVGSAPFTVSQIRRSTKATQAYCEVLHCARDPKVRSPRLAELVQLYNRLFGTEFDTESRAKCTDAALEKLNIDQWSLAVRFSRKYPDSVSIQLDELESRSASGMEDIRELRNLTVQNLLKANPQTWRTIQRSISLAIENSHKASLRTWMSLAQTSTDQALKEFLLDKLSNRIGETDFHRILINTSNSVQKSNESRPDERVKIKVDKLRLRQAINFFESKYRSLTEKNERPGDNENLELLPVAIQTNNLILFWIAAISGETEWSHFEEFQKDQQRLSLPLADFDVNTATPSESRRLSAAFEKLFNSEPHQQSMRTTALEEIESVAGKFTDIDYSNAQSLARYIIETVDSKEALALERLLPSLSEWPNLLLAISDRLQKNGGQDKFVDKLSLLDIDVSEKVESADQRSWTQQLLLQKSLSLLESQTKNVNSSWDNYQASIEEMYAIRLGLLANVKNYEIKELDQFTRKWIASSFPQRKLWLRESVIISNSFNRNEKLVALLELWIRIFADQEGLEAAALETGANKKIIEELIACELLFLNLLKKHPFVLESVDD